MVCTSYVGSVKSLSMTSVAPCHDRAWQASPTAWKPQRWSGVRKSRAMMKPEAFMPPERLYLPSSRAFWSETEHQARSTSSNVPPGVKIVTTNMICSISAGICIKSAVMTSPSRSPPSFTSSPLCKRPNTSGSSKYTAPALVASFLYRTAAMSRSTTMLALGASAPPMQMLSRLMLCPCGRSMTAPFSMTKVTFWTAGALGISLRMMSPMVGSRMSRKWRPDSAGSSTWLKYHQTPFERRSVATTSTSALLFSSANLPRLCPTVSWTTCTKPFSTSRRWPALLAATTKTTRTTPFGIFEMLTQIISL
mmetsp:Transcript_56195/g.144664  ORF Transcript_56195/g.144664 Transcript_56195/m.144664 type:complete len:307 (+) Transcript_56195:873-1793(+)